MKSTEIKVVNERVKIKVDTSRIFQNLDKAQYRLDSQIMLDMIPLMPRVTGTQINNTVAKSASVAGNGIVYAATPPYGSFLYYGKVMVDPVTGSAWARKGAKKVVTERPLKYSNPYAVPMWFEEAKKKHVKEWVKIVKETMGEGE